MTGTSKGAIRGWTNRYQRMGRLDLKGGMPEDERYIAVLYRRWIVDHDIRGIGERAVKETG